jgi:hypothetical protein
LAFRKKGAAVKEGVVHVFDIQGHPGANGLMPWSSLIEAVLQVPPITSPLGAVRAAGRCRAKGQMNLRRGAFRCWAVFAAAWMLGVAWWELVLPTGTLDTTGLTRLYTLGDLTAALGWALGVPLLALAFGYAAFWAAEGFSNSN